MAWGQHSPLCGATTVCIALELCLALRKHLCTLLLLPSSPHTTCSFKSKALGIRPRLRAALPHKQGPGLNSHSCSAPLATQPTSRSHEHAADARAWAPPPAPRGWAMIVAHKQPKGQCLSPKTGTVSPSKNWREGCQNWRPDCQGPQAHTAHMLQPKR